MSEISDRLDRARHGNLRALARCITVLESGGADAEALIAALYPSRRSARTIGITGPPGAGKSTLVDALAMQLRQRDARVAVLAVDPSSPLTGGALLGDRLRMRRHEADEHVFIRSLATRGALGGLARATGDVVDLLDAVGFDWILVETVGVGQDEVDVASAADSVVVVTVPGLGDEVQAIKAGVLEIADLFVVNKADLRGADAARRHLEWMLRSAEPTGVWTPPVLQAVARDDHGVDELTRQLDLHAEWQLASGALEERRIAQFRRRVENLVRERLLATFRSQGLGDDVRASFTAGIDPYRLAAELERRFLKES